MSLQVNSGSSTINGNVATGLAVPATGQTIVTEYFTLGSGVTTCWTVPANKIRYVVGLIPSSSANSVFYVKADSGGSTNLLLWQYSANNGKPILAPFPLFTRAATESLYIAGTTGSTVSITYIEVDVT
jgi:hypothetical protein